jgi:hypothetical protein
MFNSILGIIMLVSGPANPQVIGIPNVVLASHSFSLEDRYGNDFVNTVFKDNILLTLAYLDGTVQSKTDISWGEVTSPLHYEFELQPGQRFAFHDQILPEYKEGVAKTTNAHFNYQDGFKSDGYLTGDGVCHLASLIFWAAKDAGLDAVAPTDHDFAKIPDVPKEYGVSIYALPGAFELSARQNLYITNNLDKPVGFVFKFNGDSLTVDIVKEG